MAHNRTLGAPYEQAVVIASFRTESHIDRYLVQTPADGPAVTVNLDPNAFNGDQVVILDASGNAATFPITLAPAPGQTIDGLTSIDANGGSVELTFSFDLAAWTVRYTTSVEPTPPSAGPWVQVGELIEPVDSGAALQASGGTATGTQSVSFGPSSTASNTGAFAAAQGQASGQTSVAMGVSFTGQQSQAESIFAVALGGGTANGPGGVAIGFEALAHGESSVAIGNQATANGANSMALLGGTSNIGGFAVGTGSEASGAGSVAMSGGETQATGAIALGNLSLASRSEQLTHGSFNSSTSTPGNVQQSWLELFGNIPGGELGPVTLQWGPGPLTSFPLDSGKAYMFVIDIIAGFKPTVGSATSAEQWMVAAYNEGGTATVDGAPVLVAHAGSIGAGALNVTAATDSLTFAYTASAAPTFGTAVAAAFHFTETAYPVA